MARQDDYIRVTARIPPRLYEMLKLQAINAERSLNGQLVAILETASVLNISAQPVIKEGQGEYGGEIDIQARYLQLPPLLRQQVLSFILMQEALASACPELGGDAQDK